MSPVPGGVDTMRSRTIALIGLGLACLLGGGVGRASSPDLVVQLTDGQTSVFALENVIGLEFAADSLHVRLDAGPESFAVVDVAALTYRWTPTGISDQGPDEALTRISHLLPSQPNPWSPETRIAFELPTSGPVQLRIFGLDGRLVRALVGESRPAGRHSVRWDGKDDAGRPVASGVYVYRLEATGIAESRKLLLVR